jgi:hypothetical protein
MSDHTSSQTARIRNIPHVIANGLRYLRTRAALARLVGVGTTASAAVGVMFGILVPWAVERLDVPSSGWMFSIMMLRGPWARPSEHSPPAESERGREPSS